MNRSNFSRPEQSSSGGIVVIDQALFSQIYDRYAPVLLGIIAGIVRDEAEAVRVLEITFKEVRSQFGQFKPQNQPLFVWLLSIARRTALEAAKNQIKTSPPVFQLTRREEGTQVSIKADFSIPVTASLSGSRLLDAIFFTNCTLEEAASSVGLQIEPARQQLRLAVQQLRTSGLV